MMIFRKKTLCKVVIISLFLLTPFIFVGMSSLNRENTNSICQEIDNKKNIESTKSSFLPENNSQICDSTTGICGPPPGWYTKNQ